MSDILKIGSSAGGARAKAVIAFNTDTKEIRSGQADAPKGFTHWLLKFDGVTDQQLGTSSGYGRVEMAYHLMAKEAEIETANAPQSKTFVIEGPVVVPAQLSIQKEMSWEGFLNYLNVKAPASASNLEQGNITSPLRLENGELSIELGFGYSGLVFMDYLSEPEVFQKLINNLSEYFEVEKNKIKLQLLNVQSTENFISTAAIKEQLAEISMQERVDNFKNNPILKEAEKMFNAKVDKVIIDNIKK